MSFQQLAKEALVLYDSTIYEINVTIKVDLIASDPLPTSDGYENARPLKSNLVVFKL